MTTHRTLVLCSFFQSDSLVEEAVRAYGPAADLLLVPIEEGVEVPEVAQPYLAEHRGGPLPETVLPYRKWRTVEAILDRVDIDDYDWFIFADDDLEYPPGFLERFLRLAEEHDLGLAQPSLSPDSFHTWEICVQKPGSLLRLTNFVEIMVPCFRRDCLEALRPTLDSALSPMGYGFDLHWGYACEAAGFSMGIVDATPVSHRHRPVGTHYAGDDLHGQGYAYGAVYPRLLAHEICERETIGPED